MLVEVAPVRPMGAKCRTPTIIAFIAIQNVPQHCQNVEYRRL